MHLIARETCQVNASSIITLLPWVLIYVVDLSLDALFLLAWGFVLLPESAAMTVILLRKPLCRLLQHLCWQSRLHHLPYVRQHLFCAVRSPPLRFLVSRFSGVCWTQLLMQLIILVLKPFLAPSLHTLPWRPLVIRLLLASRWGMPPLQWTIRGYPPQPLQQEPLLNVVRCLQFGARLLPIDPGLLSFRLETYRLVVLLLLRLSPSCPLLND